MKTLITEDTNDSSINDYLNGVITQVKNNEDNISGNNVYLDDLSDLKNKAYTYANTINTTNRTLVSKNAIINNTKTNLTKRYAKDKTKFSEYLKNDLPEINSLENYINDLTKYFKNFKKVLSRLSSGKTTYKLNDTEISNFKQTVEKTYDDLNNMLNTINNIHDNCKPFIKTYGICSSFYDNYIKKINECIFKVINVAQEYHIFHIEKDTETPANTVTSQNYTHALFLPDNETIAKFLLNKENIAVLYTKSDMYKTDLNLEIMDILNNYVNSLNSRRSELTDKTINILDKILKDNCEFVVTSTRSQFNNYTLNANYEHAIECNAIHELECKSFLYVLFNNLEKFRNDIRNIKSIPFKGDLAKSLQTALNDIEQRRSIYTIKLERFTQNIYIRLPYLINYCDLITLCNNISAKNKSSFGNTLNDFFIKLSALNVMDVEGGQVQSDKIYDNMFNSIISNYILKFNMLAFHTTSNKILTIDEIDSVGFFKISDNIATNNIYVNNIDICMTMKKSTDISRSTGKIKISMILCYTALLFSIIFNVSMFVFKEKIRNKFNSPTSSKVINNVFYWVNLSCIVAAGLSSFLRITDIYNTSFFARLGVVVTVNVITMIFCSFSLYFIDPNTFWNTTAKTGETKNTENNNANAKQQSSN